MTLKEAIINFRTLRDAPFDDAMLTEWLSEIDAAAVDEVISKCDKTAKIKRFDYLKDREEALSVPFPDEGIYFLYLSMKSDLVLGDAARYNLSALAFENAWKSFAERYFRNNLPSSRKIKIGGKLELFQT